MKVWDIEQASLLKVTILNKHLNKKKKSLYERRCSHGLYIIDWNSC